MGDSRRHSFDAATYHRLDQATKLVGVVLVAAGLEAGGGTTMGLGLGLAGASLALCTVFVDVDDEDPPSETDEQRDSTSTTDA